MKIDENVWTWKWMTKSAVLHASLIPFVKNIPPSYLSVFWCNFSPLVFKLSPLLVWICFQIYLVEVVWLMAGKPPQFHGDLFSRNFKCPAARNRHRKHRGFCPHILSSLKGRRNFITSVTSSCALFVQICTTAWDILVESAPQRWSPLDLCFWDHFRPFCFLVRSENV